MGGSLYSEKISRIFEKKEISVGDRIRVSKRGITYEGILMPRIEAGDENCIVLKLNNGYNIGIAYEDGIGVEKIGEGFIGERHKIGRALSENPLKPTVSILATGGTIASRVDYRTGGVIPIFSAEEIVAAIPEISDVCNVRARYILSIFSEDMQFGHYKMIARAIAEEINKGGIKGIIIMHGTDTMHYTSAALSFMLKNLPVPVVLVGAQRSSDRGSSDATMNMLCATRFVLSSDFRGVFICMHGTISDDYCLVHRGVKVRKMHTSRRDAFRSINAKPLARVWADGRVEKIDEYEVKAEGKFEILDKFEDKVALVKVYPGFHADILRAFRGYKGVVIEGTGLGHMPINKSDEHTEENERIFDEVKELAKKAVVVMASQCIYGRVDMDVYSTGRDLKKVGVIPAGDMLPEVAYIKLKWALGNFPEKAKEIMLTNIAGEMNERILEDDFLV